MDRYLLHFIRRPVGRFRLVDRLMIHVAERGPLWFFAVLAGLAWQGGREARFAVAEALVAAVLTRGFNEAAGRLFFRERPFVREGIEPLIQHRPSFSFPSNHAACGFALAVAVWLHAPAVGSLLLAFAVLLAFSRVYVGVHYPFDVLTGAVVGSCIAWLLVLIGP